MAAGISEDLYLAYERKHYLHMRLIYQDYKTDAERHQIIREIESLNQAISRIKNTEKESQS